MTADDGARTGGGSARAADIRRRYSRWMTAYPPVWRREHGEALLGTFLEDAEARGRTGPSARDAAGILRHGLAWRVRLLAPSAPTRRLASMLALGSGTAVALTAFVLAEWQPRVAATGWRTEPGHVGPFATLGVLVYAAWFAAMTAALLGRARAARWVLVGALLMAMAMAATLVVIVPAYLIDGSLRSPGWGTVLGFRRPPAWLMASMAGLAALALAGPLRLTRTERVVTLVAGLAGAALLSRSVLGTEVDGLVADPALDFYRRAGFFQVIDVVGYQLVPLAVLVAALAWRWRRTWLPAVLLWSFAFVPYASPLLTLPRSIEIWVNRFSYDVVALPQVLHSVLGWGGALVLALAVRRRWRRGRPVDIPGPAAVGMSTRS